MSTLDNQRTYHSGSVILKLGTNIIGAGQGVTATETWNTQPVPYGFGSIMPMEHVITEWSATVDVDKFLIKTKSLYERGHAPSGNSILNLPPITIQLLERNNEETSLVSYLDCTCQTRSISVTNNAIVGERATFVALDVEYNASVESTQRGREGFDIPPATSN